MHFLSLIILAAGFLLAGQSVASAAPLIAPIVGAVLGSGLLAKAVTAILTIGLTVAANLIPALLAKKPKNQSAASGVSADVKLGSGIYHEGAFGRVNTKGHYVYVNTSGDNNKKLDQVFVLSTGWCDALETVHINDEEQELVEIDRGTGWVKYVIHLPDDGPNPNLWLTFWDGRPDQAVNERLKSRANPSNRWTDEHVGAGICYVHLEADFSSNIDEFRSLLSGNAIKFTLRGLRLYDPRKDDTAGGSGAHRWDNPATWEWSENPFIAAYNYARGLHCNGTRYLGMEVPAYDLMTDLIIASANASDEEIEAPDGSIAPRYRMSLIANDGQEHIETIESMLAAAAGQRVERQGQFGFIAGVSQITAGTITDGDLILGEPVEFSAKRSREDLINEVHGQFTDPDNLWDGSDCTPVIGDASVKEVDGGETRPAEIDLYQVPYRNQAERLLRIAYWQNRYQASAMITVGMRAIKYEVGDWITWDSDQFGTRKYQITGHELDVTKNVIRLSLAEVHENIYLNALDDAQPTALPPTLPARNPRPTNVNNFVVQPTAIIGPNGQEWPAIALGWEVVTDETITAVISEHRIKDQPETSARTIHPRPPLDEWSGSLLDSGIAAGADYEVRVTIRTVPLRLVTWSDWESVETTGTYRVQSAQSLYDEAAGSIDVAEIKASLSEATDAAGAAQEVADTALETATDGLQAASDRADQLEHQAATGFQAANDRADELQAQANDNTLRVIASVIDQTTAQQNIEGDIALARHWTQQELVAGEMARAEMGRELTAKIGDNTAYFSEQITALATADSAQVEQITALRTDLDDNTALVGDVRTSVDGLSGELTQFTAAFSGELNNVTAQGLLDYLNGNAAQQNLDSQIAITAQ
ncbi:hypothetical protein, partial [Roseibium sp. RKSG952]|uniref:hypothetical protein n=1 Tax=Roseibium sp. RKSG952 TaxID=2529384 RepID=UPI0012BBE2E4